MRNTSATEQAIVNRRGAAVGWQDKEVLAEMIRLPKNINGDRRPAVLPVRSFTVDEYHRLMDVGILKSGDPYELIDGLIVPKMTVHPPHAALFLALPNA